MKPRRIALECLRHCGVTTHAQALNSWDCTLCWGEAHHPDPARARQISALREERDRHEGKIFEIDQQLLELLRPKG